MNILRFLRWMHARGWPTFLYAHPDGPLYQQASESPVEVRSLPTRSRYGSLSIARRAARALDKDRLAILILHQSRDMLLGEISRRLSKTRPKTVFHQHMHIGGNKKDFYHAWLYRQLDAFVTPVAWLAAQVKQRTVVPENRLYIIPRGIELDRYLHQRPDKQLARQQLDLPREVPLLGLIGRLDPQKGQLVVIRALHRLHEQGHRLHLVLVGARTRNETDAYVTAVKNEVAAHNLESFVHFRDYQPRTETAFAALDYFVMASQSETYGMVTVEALASSLPVIGTAEGGTVDLIDHETNGLLFPPGDDTALAACLRRYLTDPAFAARMAARAEQDALAKYSHEQQCRSWEQLFLSLHTR